MCQAARSKERLELCPVSDRGCYTQTRSMGEAETSGQMSECEDFLKGGIFNLSHATSSRLEKSRRVGSGPADIDSLKLAVITGGGLPNSHVTGFPRRAVAQRRQHGNGKRSLHNESCHQEPHPGIRSANRTFNRNPPGKQCDMTGMDNHD